MQIASEGEEVRFSEALAALRRARSGIVRRGELARAQMSLRGRQQEVALFDAVAALALDQSLRPTEPSTGAARVAASEETKAEPERRACGGQAVAGVEQRVIPALLRRQHLLVASCKPGRPREAVEIFGPERGRHVRARQRVERVVPIVAFEGGASLRERRRGVARARLAAAWIPLVRGHGGAVEIRRGAG